MAKDQSEMEEEELRHSKEQLSLASQVCASLEQLALAVQVRYILRTAEVSWTVDRYIVEIADASCTVQVHN